MDDVAAVAGVSRALVSLVMRGSPKVSDKRRQAVLEAAKQLGYRPNAAARRLAERRSNTVGVVINDLHNTFFADVVDGIHSEATAQDYRLLLNSAWRRGDDEVRAVESFIEYQVDAVILVGTRVEHGTLRQLDQEIPLVAVGVDVPELDAVTNDDERGGELAAHHILGLGHTSVAHIDGGPGAGAAQRRRGFVSTCAEYGVSPLVLAGDFTEASGARAVQELLSFRELPTAIFAANDLVAVAARDRLEDAGLRVPDDISVVGYDNTALAALNHIALTTINQPRTEMGRTALQCAVERIDSGRGPSAPHVLEPDLVIRSTTGPPPLSPPSSPPTHSRSG